jgi:DNA-binding Lrp family transcriptional regulator
VIAEQLGISETECIGSLRRLSAQGILRGIMPAVSWRNLGFNSVLLGIQVDEAHIDSVATEIDRGPGVTHNYSRTGSINLWCTYTYATSSEKESFVERLRSLPGVATCREFPAQRTYKIGLVLDV